jgi:hypothetical protein
MNNIQFCVLLLTNDKYEKSVCIHLICFTKNEILAYANLDNMIYVPHS